MIQLFTENIFGENRIRQKLSIIVLLCLIAHTAMAQAPTAKPKAPPTVLSGVVMDAKDSSTLIGATVYIPDLKLGVVTDANGHYIFRELPHGTFLVEVTFIGYQTLIKTIVLNGDTKQNFKLAIASREVNEVVVTGISKATEIKRNPVPITTIDNDFLVTNSANNAIDAIATIPGVSAVTTGPNISKPYIRGLGYNRILTLYDGERQEGQQWGDEHGIEVDQYSVQSAEVIKGPASLSYGSDALAGVVNLIPMQPAPEGKMIGDLLTEYQTNNKFIGSSIVLGATKKGIEWMVRASHKQAIDYTDKYDGRVFGTAFSETDADASVGIHRKWGYSHLTFVAFNDLQEIPDGSRDSATRQFTKQISEADTYRPIVPESELNSYKIEPLHQHVQHYRVYSANNFILGSGSLDVNVGFQSSIRQEFAHPDYPSIPGLYLQLQTYTYDIKYNLPDMNKWSSSIGTNGMYQNNTSTNGTDFVIPSYQQYDVGGFAVTKRTFGKLDIAGGVRYDVRYFSNTGLYSKTDADTIGHAVSSTTPGAQQVFSPYSNTYSGVTGSAGATYNFSNNFSMKANIGRGYRAPNVAEISANGVHPGTNVYQIGNPGLLPEFSLQEDIGAVYSTKLIVAELDLFNNNIDNYIYNQKQDTVIVKGNETFRFTSSRADLYGGEFSLDIHPMKALHIENSLSVVYGDNLGIKGKGVTDSTRYLPLIPPIHDMVELRYNFVKKLKHLTATYVKVQMVLYSKQDRVFSAYGTETPTPGYTLFNAGLGGGFKNKKGTTIFNLHVMGSNLFNVAYQDNLSRLKYFDNYPVNYTGRSGIYNMGRNVSIKLDFPLNFSI